MPLLTRAYSASQRRDLTWESKVALLPIRSSVFRSSKAIDGLSMDQCRLYFINVRPCAAKKPACRKIGPILEFTNRCINKNSVINLLLTLNTITFPLWLVLSGRCGEKSAILANLFVVFGTPFLPFDIFLSRPQTKIPGPESVSLVIWKRTLATTNAPCSRGAGFVYPVRPFIQQDHPSSRTIHPPRPFI